MNAISTCINAAATNWARMPNFIRAAATTVATELFLQGAAIALFPATFYGNVRPVHRAAHFISSSVITGCFFREKHQSLSDILKHPMALRYALGLSVLPFFPVVERTLLKVCEVVSKNCPDTGIINKIESVLMNPLRSIDRTFRKILRPEGFFNSVVWAPLSEELRNRFVLQKIFLREIPKLLLSFTRYKPALADHPVCKTVRVALSLYIFIQSHRHQAPKVKITNALISVQWVYLNENLGLGQAIINHAAYNLFLCISRSYHNDRKRET